MMNVAITPRRVCAVCEAFLGYEHEDSCSADGVVQYGDTVEKWTTVQNSDEHPHKAGTSPYDEREVTMPSDEVLKAALATSTTYAMRDDAGKLEYQERVKRLLAAVEPLIRDEAQREIREIAGQAAGAASGVFLRMHPQEVMPSAEVSEAVDFVLQSFGILPGRGMDHPPSQWTVNGESREFGSQRYYPLAPSGSYDSIGWPEVGDVLVVVRHYGTSDSSSEN